MDTGQKTESLAQLVYDINQQAAVLPEFQRDFVWDVEKTYDLFDSFVRDIFVGALIYGVPSFEITVREIDTRPRTGKGAKKKLSLKSYTRQDIENLVKTKGFRLLLDGQQRATSIFRALSGVDPVYFVCLPDDQLGPEAKATAPSKRSLEQVLQEFRGDLIPNRVCIALSDVYRMLQGEMPRERDKLAPFLTSCPQFQSDEGAESSNEFETYLTQAKNIENLLRQEKLVAYYLLDTDEAKFATFFERSNSKGLQLSFIDILAAKVYGGFNLRAAIERFDEEEKSLRLSREVVVRSISYISSGGKDTGRAYILSKLTAEHFVQHWDDCTNAFKASYDWLFKNRLLINQTWIPYESMLVPLTVFLRSLPKHDYAVMSESQSKTVQLWYWLTTFSRRYSSAAQGVVNDDSAALQKLALGDTSHIAAWLRKLEPVIRNVDDIIVIHRRYDAVYKGLLNFVHWNWGGLVNWANSDYLSQESDPEDHHIFPRDYLRKHASSGIDPNKQADSVVNRTLIPKLTNVKVGSKKPSIYLSELSGLNPKINLALDRHAIPTDLVCGTYDEMFELFLEDRGKLILDAVRTRVFDARTTLVALHDEKPHDGA